MVPIFFCNTNLVIGTWYVIGNNSTNVSVFQDMKTVLFTSLVCPWSTAFKTYISTGKNISLHVHFYHLNSCNIFVASSKSFCALIRM